jgi:hypothetical protein
LRVEFAKGFRWASLETAKVVDNMILDALFYGEYFKPSVFRAVFGIEKKFRESWENPEKGESEKEAIARILGERAGKPYGEKAFLGAYFRFEKDDYKCYGYNGEHVPDKKLELLYHHLTALGYVMSEDEAALLDGTHALYTNVQEG